MSRVLVPVTIPSGLSQEIDELVQAGKYSSRAEAMRFGARLLVMMEGSTRERAMHYAYHDITEGLRRGLAYVPRHRRVARAAQRP